MDFLGKAETFVRIVEAGSLSTAARSLGLSLAAVSRQVSSLEAELGATLLLRTTRRTHLTEEGRRFHEHATRLVRDAATARASVRPDGAIGGQVVLSATVTLGILCVVPTLPKLLALHPSLALELRLEERSVDLVGEGVDIAVRSGLELPDTTSLAVARLASFERVMVASPAYLRRHGVPRTAASLAQRDAVLGLRSSVTWHLDEAGESVAVTVTPKLRVGTLLAVRAAVLAGLGLAVLPDFVVVDDLATGALRRVLPKATRAPVTAHALYRLESRGSASISAVVSYLQQIVPSTRR